MTEARRDNLRKQLADFAGLVFQPLSEALGWASAALRIRGSETQLDAIIGVVCEAVLDASAAEVDELSGELFELGAAYREARPGRTEQSLIWHMAQTLASDEVLGRLARLQVAGLDWKGAVASFDAMHHVPTTLASSYCSALIQRGRPNDVADLLRELGVANVERGEHWLRIATSVTAAEPSVCTCATHTAPDPPQHVAIKEVLWFADDQYDDEWTFCLDCHQLWNGGTVMGEPQPWKRVVPADMDHEGLWQAGFGVNAHPGSDLLNDPAKFVRWVVCLEGPEYASSLP